MKLFDYSVDEDLDDFFLPPLDKSGLSVPYPPGYKRPFNSFVIPTKADSRQLKILMGKRKRIDNLQKTLGRFFRYTKENGRYAQNWNDKGKLVPALITLTYPSNDDWGPRHISDFIDHLQKYAKRKMNEKLRYAWVAETTKAGVIHYHVVVWHLRNVKFPKPDDKGWWPHGHSKIEAVRRGVFSYLKKYLSKGSDFSHSAFDRYGKNGQRLPVRTFSYGGLTPVERKSIAYSKVPLSICKAFGPIPVDATIKRVKGGWYCSYFDTTFYPFPHFKGTWYSGVFELFSFVPSNWDRFYDEQLGDYQYEYGVSWCSLPDPDLEPTFIPF